MPAVELKQQAVLGPVPGTRLTEEYIRLIGRFAYLLAWPMMNVHNRRAAFEKVPEPGLAGGVVPVAPPNQIAMLHDYITPYQRMVACPNQDVAYGYGIMALDREPAVVQVPDFGDRFWVYQIGDQRTDGFANLGKMYGSKPGFYLLVGPDWNATHPKGIEAIFQASTRIGYVVPRVFMDDTAEDRKAILPLVNHILVYPLSRFDGKLKTRDWTKAPTFPSQGSGNGEMKWVTPDNFFDLLPKVLVEAPPLPGEESIYALVSSVLQAARQDPKVKETLKRVAKEAEEELLEPVFQFRNYGLPLPDNWTTIKNGAAFGTDYFTRAAVAKSNIFVNKPNETKYFYQDLDSTGARLNGSNRYLVTFTNGNMPPVRGFWSLTLYNKHHFFHPNELKRYSLGTKNKDLRYNADGSLTLYMQEKRPEQDKLTNWLPAPKGEFSLFVRTYWPDAAITEGKWTPPPVVASGR
ncbi:MAG: DUF1214 domain-containing protein [Acidobacteria bacterium]|nr:DUF1214 domain-containing protein [Acidobacteriota bacterium]